MSLEDEIELVRFGQGILTAAELQDRFRKLDKEDKKTQLFDLTSLVDHTAAVDSDIELAIAESGLDPNDAACVFLQSDRFKVNRVLILPEKELDSAYTLQLSLFKIAYQRRYEQEKGSRTQWWFWDLSPDGVVQDILKAYQQLVEEVYTNPGFRSEFASLAKLWYEDKMMMQARFPEIEPDPKAETSFTFVTYDDIVTDWTKFNEEHSKFSGGAAALRNSLGRALSKLYGLDSSQETRLVVDVVERHMQEKYNTGWY